MIKEHLHFDIGEKLIIEKAVIQPPFQVSDSFVNEACFLYIMEGKSVMMSANDSFEMKQKEGVFMKCGNYLHRFLEGSEANQCQAIGIHFYPEVLKQVFDDDLPFFIQEAQKSKGVSIKKVVVDELLKNYIDSLQHYFDNPSLVNEELIKLKVRELIMLLIKTDHSNAIQSILQDLFNPETYTFREVVEAHLYDNVGVEDLAGLAGLSVSSFKRKFKDVYQTSPAKYLKVKKLEKAADLLKVSNQRISEIAYDSGFNDLAHFSNSFLSHYGKNPSDYRDSF